jgi:hypothetical protein
MYAARRCKSLDPKKKSSAATRSEVKELLALPGGPRNIEKRK